MRIGELIAGLGVRPAGKAAGRLDVRICDLTEDSRTAVPGSLFIARAGEKADGRQFVKQAVELGAVAVLTDDAGLQLPKSGAGHAPPVLLVAEDVMLVSAQMAERFYGNPSSKLTLAGVTGTNGKTTTTFLVHQILNALGVRCGLMGTVVIDDGVEVAPASLTTPPALEISRTLARMLDAGCEAAVMEVSSHALHQRRVGAMEFDVGVFTNLTGDHLDYHGTMENYAAAKAMLFQMLPADGAAVVNADDPAHEGMVRGCRARVLGCSSAGRPGAGYSARIERRTPAYTDCVFRSPEGTRAVRLPLVGDFNVMNTLQAAAAVHAGFGERGMSMDRIVATLERCAAPPGRLEPVTTPESPIAVYVDYAHTDDALQTVLRTLRGSMTDAAGNPTGTLTCIFGCGGDRDRTKRPRMGAAAAALADRIVITSDNPRTEDARRIIDEIAGGVPLADHARTTIEADRERAIRTAIARATPGECVLIAGKGHEDYQILPDGKGGTTKVHFDDREVARRCASLRGLPVRAAARATVVADEQDADDVVASLAEFGGESMEARTP